MSGLKDEIKLPIRVFNLKSLTESHSLAKLQEAFLSALSKVVEPVIDDELPLVLTKEMDDTMPQISVHALTGLQGYQTIRVTSIFNKRKLHILIDLVSTHNYLDVLAAERLRCPVTPIKPVKVVAADGTLLPCTSLCQHFGWRIQGKEFVADVLVLTMKNCDLVLGK